MNLTPTSKLIMSYKFLPMGICSRGGVERFFFLSQNIPFEEKLWSGAEWPVEKKRLLETGENPCGGVPLLYVENEGDDSKGLPLSQHLATCRYVGKIHGVTSDLYHEYVQDMVSDEYISFRDSWKDHAFGASDEVKAQYMAEGMKAQLTKFEVLYQKFRTHDVFLSVSEKTGQPLWGDAAMFVVLWDHIVMGMLTVEDLKAYSCLAALFQAYRNIPGVKEWCDSKEEEAKKK